MTTKQDSTRSLAFRILNRVIYRGAYPDLELKRVFRSNNLSPRDTAFLTELVYGVIRWLGKLDYITSLFVRKRVGKEILNVLRIGAYQLLFLEGVSDYAAIHETVNVAKAVYGEKIGGFINAVLREILRKKDEIHYPLKDTDPIGYIEINYSFPGWLVEKWVHVFGLEYAEKLCDSLNRVPPLTVRVNTLKTNREELIEKLKTRNIEVAQTEYSESGVSFLTHLDPASLSEFDSGLFTVQDEAAQLVQYLLDPKPGERILDTCSAPGGKSTHIAELMHNQGEIVALDINKTRLNLVGEGAERLGIDIIKTVHADASSDKTLEDYECGFDKILVDAPCSGLGTIRRNPDVKWKKSTKNILELSDIQFRILSQVSRTLKPGGIMVYAVCTLMPEENEGVCERFLSKNPEFKIDAAVESTPLTESGFFNESGFFITDPVKHNMDAFFAARFRKEMSIVRCPL